MAHLIDKNALIAEIERLDEFYHLSKSAGGQAFIESLFSFLNTLEVKEKDLSEEMDKEWDKCEPIDEGMGLEIASIEHEQFDNIAKHFFELGLNAKKED